MERVGKAGCVVVTEGTGEEEALGVVSSAGGEELFEL